MDASPSTASTMGKPSRIILGKEEAPMKTPRRSRGSFSRADSSQLAVTLSTSTTATHTASPARVRNSSRSVR